MQDNRADALTEQEKHLVKIITHLPHRILQYYDIDGLSQLLLCEIGRDRTFGLTKAAYFVDNPDFDHFMGVAGYCQDECGIDEEDVWDDPHHFLERLAEVEFNNKIKGITETSVHRKHLDLQDKEEILELGRKMGMKNPHYFVWNMKHDNHGVLIYEHDNTVCEWRKSLLENIAAILSLCSVH